MVNSTACKYHTERCLGWMLNNKIIVFLSLLSFCLFVSTLTIAGQRNRLTTELSDLKNSIENAATTPAAEDVETTPEAVEETTPATEDVQTTPKVVEETTPATEDIETTPEAVEETTPATEDVQTTPKVVEETTPATEDIETTPEAVEETTPGLEGGDGTGDGAGDGDEAEGDETEGDGTSIDGRAFDDVNNKDNENTMDASNTVNREADNTQSQNPDTLRYSPLWKILGGIA